MKNFVESLLQASDMKEHYAYLDSKATEDPSELVTIFQALPKDWIKLLNCWQQRAAYSRILEAICLTPGKAQMKAAIQIADMVTREKDFDRIGAFLATSQNADELLALLISSNAKKSRALMSLVMHELVARGVDLRTSSDYATLEKINQASSFKSLSLFPLEGELENNFPSFGIGSSSASIEYTLKLPFTEINRNETVEVSEYKEDNSIALAFLNWEEASNGKILGIHGNLKQVASAETILASLSPFSEDNSLQIQEEERSEVIRYLFSASSKGGAYNSGVFGAKGRLHTWTSLSRMMGDTELTSNELVAKKMHEFSWYRFTTDRWFNNEIWDLGILCVRKSGLEFGLVAGTDID